MPISHLTRREFGACLCALPLFSKTLDDWADASWNQPATVARVYLGAPQPHWPKPTLNLDDERAQIEQELGDVARKNAHVVRFTGGELLRTPEQVRPWLAQFGGVDGLLAIPLAQPTPPLRALVENAPAPVLFFSRPYATHAWSSVAAMRQEDRKIDVIATSSYGDLDPYLKAFRTVHHLRNSKVLVGAATPGSRQQTADAFAERMGVQFQFVTGSAFRDAFESTNARLAAEEAARFTQAALRVVEPSPKEIGDGVRFYVAILDMMKAQKANAVTIDCFGTMAASTLPGYPCIAFSKLNDAGLYGVCEGDLASTMTQMLVTSFAGVPGFVSDPVFDISRNEVIHAHCVAATKMKGPHGPSSPYIIRNHLETNEGAVLQVLMPVGEKITVGRFASPTRFLISTAEVTGTVDSDRGCRTQIRTRVDNAQKWLRGYTAGLHRVIFYGDYVEDVERLGRLMGFEVVHEA